jgi:hypothetical protein
MNFQSLLIEYLTDEQRNRFKRVDMTHDARAATDHYFGKGNDKVVGHVEEEDGHQHEKSEIHKAVERHIGRAIAVEDYRAGKATDHLGRQTRLGRLIKDAQLRDQFASDNTREGSKKGSNFTTSTHRGIEVAGQTNSEPDAKHPNGHSWEGQSCKNVDTGSNRHYLEPEIQHGTIVHFVHDHDGKEIYRATLQPHLHNDHPGKVVYAIDSEYGIKHPAFTASAHKVAQAASTPDAPKNVTYRKHKDVYDDSGDVVSLHPKATASDLHHIATSPDTNRGAMEAVSTHPALGRHTIEHLIDNWDHSSSKLNDEGLYNIATHKNSDGTLWEKGVKTLAGGGFIRNLSKLIDSPHATSEGLKHILPHSDSPDMVRRIASHPRMDGKTMRDFHNEEGPAHYRAAALHHPTFSSDDVKKFVDEHLKAGRHRVVAAAIRNNHKVTSEHLQTLANAQSGDVGIEMAIVTHPNASIHAIGHTIKNSDRLDTVMDHAMSVGSQSVKRKVVESSLNLMDEHVANGNKHNAFPVAAHLVQSVESSEGAKHQLSSEQIEKINRHVNAGVDEFGHNTVARVQQRLIQQHNVTPDVLHDVALMHNKAGREVTSSMRERVLKHPKLADHTVDHLIQHGNEDVLDDLVHARGSNLAPHHVSKLFDKDFTRYGAEIGFGSKNHETIEHAYKRAKVEGNEHVMNGILYNKHLPSHVISDAIGDDKIRNMLLSSRRKYLNATPEHVDHLLSKTDAHPKTPARIAKSFGDMMSDKHISAILDKRSDGDELYHDDKVEALSKSPNFNGQHITQVMNQPGGAETAYHASLHRTEHFTSKHFDKMIDGYHSGALKAAERGKVDAINADHIAKLLVHPDTAPTTTINDNYDFRTHAKALSSHPDHRVRLAVAKSRAVDKSTYEKLANDPHPEVAAAAKRRA